MTALSADKALSIETWDDRTFTLKSGESVWKGAAIAIELGGGYVVEATGAADEVPIGVAMERVDASSAAKSIPVKLFRPFELRFFANGSSIASTDLGATVYLADDQTVTLATTGLPFGRVWAVDSVRGVGVQVFEPRVNPTLLEGATLAFTAGAITIGDYPVSGTVYDVPTTAANSTIDLPANAREGTELVFVADGTKNGHTVQYRDVTTAISAALTASKRHQARAVFLNSKWTVLTTVAP